MKSALAKSLELPVPERIKIVTEIWESIAKNPEDELSWKEVREKILNK